MNFHVRPVLKQNENLLNYIQNLCELKGVYFKHNVSSINSKDGYHRYVVLNPSITNSNNNSIKSKNCIFYSESRFSKYYLPSIKSESAALTKVIEFLKRLPLPNHYIKSTIK